MKTKQKQNKLQVKVCVLQLRQLKLSSCLSCPCYTFCFQLKKCVPLYDFLSLCKLRFLFTAKSKFLFLRSEVTSKTCFPTYTKPVTPLITPVLCLHCSFKHCANSHLSTVNTLTLSEGTSRSQLLSQIQNQGETAGWPVLCAPPNTKHILL